MWGGNLQTVTSGSGTQGRLRTLNMWHVGVGYIFGGQRLGEPEGKTTGSTGNKSEVITLVAREVCPKVGKIVWQTIHHRRLLHGR